MSELYKNRYKINSTRADWWDYNKHGAYFITICTYNRLCILGDIGSEIHLSPIGEIAFEEWQKSFQMRHELSCDTSIMMPNHIHAIVCITDETNVETHGRASPGQISSQMPYRLPKSISSFVAGFKSSATKRINDYRNLPRQPVWQARYYDRIIRNDDEYNRIAAYIADNPTNWRQDDLWTSK